MASLTISESGLKLLQKKFGAEILKVKVDRGETFICTTLKSLREVLRFLRDEPELDYKYFSECVGVDYSAWKHERDLSGRFEVVYNLMSLRDFSRVFVKVSTDDGTPIPSVKDIFLGAEYPEREIQDLYGVIFSGNEPEAGSRFMLPNDWVGFPLRKEYPLGGEDVVFAEATHGPAVEDKSMPQTGPSFEGKTGSSEIR